MYRFYAACALMLSILCNSCSKVPPADDGFVSDTLANRIDGQVLWRKGCCEDRCIRNFIESVITQEMTADVAIQIALLNNPKIQAEFEELGIARADLVAAGLLSNPAFEIEVRFPQSGNLYTNIEYLLTSSLLDIFLVPLRTKMAATEFEQVKLKVSNAILNLAFDVRSTFYELVAERKKIKFMKDAVELNGVVGDIALQQASTGNINVLEYRQAQSRFLESELALSQLQAEIVRLKERLNKLLGFCNDPDLILPENCPTIDFQEFDLCMLEYIALQNRLDIQIAHFEISRIRRMLGLKQWWTYTTLFGGLAGEREPDGENVLGPGFVGEIPIFNYGQADRMRLCALLRQAYDRLNELEIQALAEVREAHLLLVLYLNIINDYQTKLLPMQSEVLVSSQEQYNVMGLGLNKLLENKEREIVANLNYTESIKKYLLARVQLDRSLGGNLFKMIAMSGAECQGAQQ